MQYPVTLRHNNISNIKVGIVMGKKEPETDQALSVGLMKQKSSLFVIHLYVESLIEFHCYNPPTTKRATMVMATSY